MIDPLELPLIWIVVMAAAILRAFTGFGFGLAAVPAFALLLTPAQVGGPQRQPEPRSRDS
uniref:Uncharacterized protein n=1 Tax=Candidatus Kentrum sp. TC TaxID=2126339 RepID=A0A450Z5A5_9GAMM|nr:MAG: hypothetical protein BECKTC1821E_GA0114239_11481 [Candidatus Kentron sp. TC]